MSRSRKAAFEVFDNPILVGTVTILIVIVAVYLSYIAENGLPFVPTYNVKVDVANAAELVKNADVRVGGARVGQVLTITPEPATKQCPHPYAQLGLALQKSLEPLPMNTKYQVRLASVLGGKYVEIVPGTSKGAGLPDGGDAHAEHEARPEPQHPVRRPRHRVRDVRPEDPAGPAQHHGAARRGGGRPRDRVQRRDLQHGAR